MRAPILTVPSPHLRRHSPLLTAELRRVRALAADYRAAGLEESARHWEGVAARLAAAVEETTRGSEVCRSPESPEVMP